MKSLLTYLRGISTHVTIGMMLLTLLFVSLFSQPINQYITQLTPNKIVTIEVTRAGTVQFVTAHRWNDCTNEMLNGDSKGAWKYYPEIAGQQLETLESSGDNIGSTLTFTVRGISTYGFLVYTNGSDAEIRVTAEGYDRTFDFEKEKPANSFYKIYPFERSYTIVIIKLLIYAVIGFIAFIVMVLLHKYLCETKKRIKKSAFVLMKYDYRYAIVLGIIVFFWALFQYDAGLIPNFMPPMGDAADYWLNGATKWMHTSVTFRGYLAYLPSKVFHAVNEIIGVDPVVLWFLYLSTLYGFAYGYALPKIFEMFNREKIKLYQFVSFCLITVFFWNGFTTAILMNGVSVSFLIIGGMFLIKCVRLPFKIYNAWIAGIFVCACVQVHPGVMILVYVLCASTLGLLFYSFLTNKTFFINNLNRRHLIIDVLLFAVGFTLIGIPELISNLTLRNVWSLIPYDAEYSWLTDMPRTLIETTQFGRYRLEGYPFSLPADGQIKNIFTSLIANENLTASIQQALAQYIANPLDTLIVIGKRLFAGLNVRTNVTYPDYIYDPSSTSNMLFSYLNYLILGCGIYTLFKVKKTTSEKIFIGAVFFITILPLTIIQIEWREYLLMYIVFYYLVAFKLLPLWMDRSERIKLLSSGFLMYLGLYVYLSEMIGRTMMFSS